MTSFTPNSPPPSLFARLANSLAPSSPPPSISLLPLHATTSSLPPLLSHHSLPVQHDPTLASLSRQSTHITSTLQSLLDAQSDALLAGLTPSPPRQTSPPPQNTHNPNFPPSHPAKHPPSISSTRTRISTSLSALSRLKAAESTHLTTSLATLTSALSHLDTLTSASTTLSQKISSITTSPSPALHTLHQRESDLESSIRALEEQLRLTHLELQHTRDERARLVNATDAQASSYREARRAVETDLRQLVARRRTTSSTGRASDVVAVRQSLHAQRDELERQKADAERERHALDAGGELWRDVCAAVGRVEDALRRSLRGPSFRGGEQNRRSDRQSFPGSSVAHSSPPTPSPTRLARNSTAPPRNAHTRPRDPSPPLHAHALLATMDDAAAILDTALRTAEAEGWRFLVCAVGAEKEALWEGRGVLRGCVGEEERGGELLFGGLLQAEAEMDGEGEGEDGVSILQQQQQGLRLDGDDDGDDDDEGGYGDDNNGNEEGDDENENEGDEEPGPELLISVAGEEE